MSQEPANGAGSPFYLIQMNTHIGDLVPESIENLRLLDAEAVALKLGVTERYVALLAQRGEIEHYRFGKSLRFSLAQVSTYLAASRRGAEENDAVAAENQDAPT